MAYSRRSTGRVYTGWLRSAATEPTGQDGLPATSHAPYPVDFLPWFILSGRSRSDHQSEPSDLLDLDHRDYVLTHSLEQFFSIWAAAYLSQNRSFRLAQVWLVNFYVRSFWVGKGLFLTNKFLSLATVAVLLGVVAGSAMSENVSFGALSSNDDGGTEIITDSLNSLEWLRWDVLADKTYAEIAIATSSGGAYAGWDIAGIGKAQAFTDAFLNGLTNSCTTAQTSLRACASPLSANFDGLLGSNYSTDYNVAFFLSDNGNSQEVGLVQTSILGQSLGKLNDWAMISGSDYYSSSGVGSSITWLLYRGKVAAPNFASLP